MFKKTKKEWLVLLAVMLAAAVVSLVLVSAYFNEDRWAAFGTIGTWLTGGAAAFIAYIQYKEQKLKITDIKLSVETEVETKCAIFASSLINICTEISSWSERFSINNSNQASVLNVLDLTDDRSLWQEIQIQSYQREAVGHESTKKIDDFNALVKNLPKLIKEHLFIRPAGQLETLNRYLTLIDVMLASSKALEELGYKMAKEITESITDTKISLNRIKNPYPSMRSPR